MTQLYRGNSIAVILPCYNEAPAIAKVICGFRTACPGPGRVRPTSPNGARALERDERTIPALTLRAPYGEVHTSYGKASTQSKLATIGDSLRIMKTILKFYMLERQREFHLLLAVGGAIAALVLGRSEAGRRVYPGIPATGPRP